MLWRILQANSGTIPASVVVTFANTGREMPATLDFVRDVGACWNVPVTWLEFTARAKDGYQIVSHNSAARNGEPFAAYLAAASCLPNPVQRSCTAELKIRTIKRFIQRDLGWKNWQNVVGIRADEPSRVEGLRRPTKERWTVAMPLADAGVTKEMVLAFWREQPFDLRLAGPWEGNCDGCFLKSRASIMWMMRTHPDRMAWWPEMEAMPRGTAGKGRRFRKDREPYADLIRLTERTPLLPYDETMHDLGGACGVHCGV